MSTKFPFQFIILRYVHDSFTGEFLNVGLALYSPSAQFFRARFLPKFARITATFPDADGEHYRTYINRLQLIADDLAERVNSKQISFLPSHSDQVSELVTQILQPDDSAIQFSPIKGGMASDLDETFEDLYLRLVEAYIEHDKTASRNEAQIWHLYSKPLREYNVIYRLKPTIIHASKTDVEFEHAWKNGRWKAMQPLSFDLMHASNIKSKAFQYLGTNVVLDSSKEFSKLYYLLGEPRRDDRNLQKAYNQAKDLLGTGEHAKKIVLVEEDGAEDFARYIGPEIEKDISQEDGA